jgi:hypothetical protein
MDESAHAGKAHLGYYHPGLRCYQFPQDYTTRVLCNKTYGETFSSHVEFLLSFSSTDYTLNYILKSVAHASSGPAIL